MKEVVYALSGTMFTFMMTVAGASIVYFFRNKVSSSLQRCFLGFAAGVMIAASVWSLLIPAIEMSEEKGNIGWVVGAGGFILGVGFLLLLDKLVPHMHLNEEEPEGIKSALSKKMMLVLAVTLHNIPEGMAVGLTFAIAAQSSDITLASAMALAVGIGLQNIPEGAAISLPLKEQGLSNHKAFLMGAASGIVEPIAGVFAGLLIGFTGAILPWLLAFAAGAMMYVVVEELIPEAQLGEHSHIGTFGVLGGFLIMMILDVALG
jgi:ZIP family zinc transporter